MSCDKCYHNEVCSALYEMNGVPRIGATECAYFKDKERVVEVVRCKECVNRLIDDLASKIKRHFAGNGAVYTNTNYYVRSVVDRYAEEMKRGRGSEG